MLAGQFYVDYNVLPPSGSVTYRATFSGNNQRVYALVDTSILGQWSAPLRAAQAVSDAVSLVSGINILGYFTNGADPLNFLRTITAQTHLMAAGEALIAPSWNSANFYYELQQALNSGELQFIADRLRADVGATSFKDWLVSKTPELLQQLLTPLEVNWRNFQASVTVLYTGVTAGTVIFVGYSQ